MIINWLLFFFLPFFQSLSGNASYGPPNVLIADGASLTYDPGYAVTYYPTQLGPLMPASWAIFNVAESAATMANRIANAPTNVDPLCAASKGPRRVVILWCCENDINNGMTPAQLWASNIIYAQGRQAAGCKVIIGTMISGGVSYANQTAYNALVYANWPTYFQGIMDVGSDPTLGCQTCWENMTYFQADGVHLTTAGEAIVASPWAKGAVLGLP